MAFVTRTIQAFAFDGASKNNICVQAGTNVNVRQKVGPNFICSMGIPGFTTFLIIPASDIHVTAQDDNEKEEVREVGERAERPREEIEEPEVWQSLSAEDVVDLEDVALHKEHLTSEEFESYLTDKVMSLDSPLLQRLRRMLEKKDPNLSEDQIQVSLKEAYEKHADKQFIQRMQRGVEEEKRAKEEKRKAKPAPKAAPTPSKKGPQEFKIPPEARRMLPQMMKEKYGQRPFGTLEIPGYPGRFQIEQLDRYSPIVGLTDLTTKFYDMLGSPEIAYRKALQIVTDEREMENNPMPVNRRSGLPEISHEGYVIQRQFDKDQKELDYVFFHPKRRSQVRPGAATLEETKTMVDDYILSRAGLREEEAVAAT